jgi:hypothetical protein
MTRTTAVSTAAALLGGIALAGTACDDAALHAPQPVDPLFRSYVAIGNSITAGFQSGGINDSTQLESYAVLLARAMGLEIGREFVAPLFRPPGCPPPLVNVFDGERLGGGGPADCGLRAEIPPVFHNVAVPGAATVDVFTNDSAGASPNPLTTLILGGRTQVTAAADARPSFLTVWIGNNDVLGAALAGDAALATPPAQFEATYEELTDRLDALEAEGVVLIAVADVTLIPHLSPGVEYWEAEQAGAFPPAFTVDASCGPASGGGIGEEVRVPFDHAFGDLIARAEQGEATTLDCAADPAVLTGQEVATLRARVAAFNAVIEAEAAARPDWLYYDPNPELQALKDAGMIPDFPTLQGPDAVTEPFGPLFSRDGFHPSGAAHAIIAERLADRIDAEFGTSILEPEAGV